MKPGEQFWYAGRGGTHGQYTSQGGGWWGMGTRVMGGNGVMVVVGNGYGNGCGFTGFTGPIRPCLRPVSSKTVRKPVSYILLRNVPYYLRVYWFPTGLMGLSSKVRYGTVRYLTVINGTGPCR